MVKSIDMRARMWIALVVVLVAVVSAGVALARSGSSVSGDVSATRSYLTAERELQQAIDSAAGGRVSALQAFVEHIQSQCPNVLAGAPAGGGVLRLEAVSQLAYAGLLVVRPAYLRFAGAVTGLRWESPTLTELVHRQARSAIAAVSVAQPDICTDARQFVASSYTGEPAGTKRFLAEQRAVEADKSVRGPGAREVALAPEIAGLLRRYERPGNGASHMPVPPSDAVTERAFLAALHAMLGALGLSEE
jgi:hypothetical protein